MICKYCSNSMYSEYISNTHNNGYREFATCANRECGALCDRVVDERGRGRNKETHILEEKWFGPTST